MRRPSFKPQVAGARHAAEIGASLSRRALLAGAAVVATGGAVALSWTMIDKADHPPAGSSGACGPLPPSTSVVLIDVSEPYSDLHNGRAMVAANEAANDLPAGGRFLLAVMNAIEPENFLVRFERCAPEKPGRSEWLQGSRHAERFREEQFLSPVRVETKSIVAEAKHSVSPIMETIAALTRTPGFDGKVPRRRLVIVSDLLQNDRLPVRVERKPRRKGKVGGYTQYSTADIAASYRRSRLARRMMPDLAGVAVVVHYLVRPDAAEFQTAAHRGFWRDWLRQAGASTVDFRGIPPQASSS